MNAGLLFVTSVIAFVVGLLLSGLGWFTAHPLGTILFVVGFSLEVLSVLAFVISIIWGLINIIKRGRG